MALDYVGRAPIIINKTLTLANVWYEVTPEIKGVRKWFIKSKENSDNSFDMIFVDNQTDADAATNIMTNSGVGFAFDGCALPGTWSRSATAGTIIELLYWN